MIWGHQGGDGYSQNMRDVHHSQVLVAPEQQNYENQRKQWHWSNQDLAMMGIPHVLAIATSPGATRGEVVIAKTCGYAHHS